MQPIQRPVIGEDFFDREDVLERLKAERNFALIGQRKVGKTSIILEYLRRNPDPQVLTPYIYILFVDALEKTLLQRNLGKHLEILKIAGEEFDLVAETNGAYWIGEVKASPVRERHVEGFLAKLTRLEAEGWNIQEGLLICLAGIEEPAERRARDAGVWVWDLADVNTLLKAYGQFRIIV